MYVFDNESKLAVQKIIDDNGALLRSIPGFVSAEPGFPIIDGAVVKEPAILVFVARKLPPSHLLQEERAPRQLGPYRVSVMQADPMRQVMAMAVHADVALRAAVSASKLTYKKIDGNPIDASFTISKPMLCHVGPDDGWPVLKTFLEATKHTLSVAMYDFNADYIAKTFIDTVRANNIHVVLTWDNSMTAPETTIRTKLKTTLKTNLDGWIVQCGNNHRFDSAYHEKVAVQDSKAFWLSSGNWSTRSQPEIDPVGDPPSAKGMYSKGNREWHIIIEDEKLSKLFEQYIKYDRDGSEKEAKAGDHGAVLIMAPPVNFPDLFVPVEQFAMAEAVALPQPVACTVLPKTARDIVVQPVLTPDNYIGRIMELFNGAKHSIHMQYAYITYSDAAVDKPFTDMLKKLAELSNRPSMDMKIILGGGSSVNDDIRKLVEAGFKSTVFRVQSSIHNKGIVVDGETVLVSSANWSGDGVLRNRDAGLIIRDSEIAGYYQKVFLDDWDKRAKARLDDGPAVMVAARGAETPAGMVRMSWREYYG